MAKIQIQKAPEKKDNRRELYATVCYYYPQYKLHEVQNMSARNVMLLYKTARKQEARKFHTLTRIVAAPHTEKGKGVGQLLDEFGAKA